MATYAEVINALRNADAAGDRAAAARLADMAAQMRQQGQATNQTPLPPPTRPLRRDIDEVMKRLDAELEAEFQRGAPGEQQAANDVRRRLGMEPFIARTDNSMSGKLKRAAQSTVGNFFGVQIGTPWTPTTDPAPKPREGR